MGSKGGGSQTATTKPWSGAQRTGLNQLYQSVPQVTGGQLSYGPSTVAPFSQTTDRALSALENYGMGSGPVQQASNTIGLLQQPGATSGPGRDMMTSTAGGAFLGSNPHLDAQYDRAAQRMTDAYQTSAVPSIDARFAGGGTFGSSHHGRAQADARAGLGDQLSGLATDMYGADYARERGLMEGARSQLAGMEQGDAGIMLGAAGMAPGMNAAQLQQYQAALGAGSARDDLTGAQLAEQNAMHRFNQDSPFIQAQRANELLGGSQGYSQSSQPINRNPAAGFLGGAATMGGTAGMLGMSASNPWLAPMLLGGGLLGSM